MGRGIHPWRWLWRATSPEDGAKVVFKFDNYRQEFFVKVLENLGRFLEKHYICTSFSLIGKTSTHRIHVIRLLQVQN